MSAPDAEDGTAEPRADPAAGPRLEAGRVGVVFVRTGDRWAHRVLVDGAARFASVEGPPPAGDDRWPASPALTEVSLVATAGGTAVVGVGRAGRSHFSLSVARHPTLSDTVVFEAACRIHEPPGWLGSTYRSPARPRAGRPPEAGGARDRAAIRLPAPPGPDPAALPRTVTWSYAVSPAGIAFPVPGAGAAPAPGR